MCSLLLLLLSCLSVTGLSDVIPMVQLHRLTPNPSTSASTESVKWVDIAVLPMDDHRRTDLIVTIPESRQSLHLWLTLNESTPALITQSTKLVAIEATQTGHFFVASPSCIMLLESDMLWLERKLGPCDGTVNELNVRGSPRELKIFTQARDLLYDAHSNTVLMLTLSLSIYAFDPSTFELMWVEHIPGTYGYSIAASLGRLWVMRSQGGWQRTINNIFLYRGNLTARPVFKHGPTGRFTEKSEFGKHCCGNSTIVDIAYIGGEKVLVLDFDQVTKTVQFNVNQRYHYERSSVHYEKLTAVPISPLNATRLGYTQAQVMTVLPERQEIYVPIGGNGIPNRLEKFSYKFTLEEQKPRVKFDSQLGILSWQFVDPLGVNHLKVTAMCIDSRGPDVRYERSINNYTATSLSHAELGIDFKWEFQFVLQAKTKYNNKIISGAAFGSVYEIPSPERLAFDGFQTLKWTQQLLAEAVSHYKVHCVSTNCLTSETIIADMDEVEHSRFVAHEYGFSMGQEYEIMVQAFGAQDDIYSRKSEPITISLIREVKVTSIDVKLSGGDRLLLQYSIAAGERYQPPRWIHISIDDHANYSCRVWLGHYHPSTRYLQVHLKSNSFPEAEDFYDVRLKFFEAREMSSWNFSQINIPLTPEGDIQDSYDEVLSCVPPGWIPPERETTKVEKQQRLVPILLYSLSAVVVIAALIILAFYSKDVMRKFRGAPGRGTRRTKRRKHKGRRKGNKTRPSSVTQVVDAGSIHTMTAPWQPDTTDLL